MKAARIAALMLLVFPALAYLAVLGRALRQNENHIAIVLALPKVALTGGVARVGDGKFLTANREAFIRDMACQGYAHTDQLGSGYLFEKGGQTYLATSRQYSSRLMVFSWPEEDDNVGSACTDDSECNTPFSYLIRSSCPFESKCVDNRCHVVCLTDFGADGPNACTTDVECSDRNGKNDLTGASCRCLSGRCFRVEGIDASAR
jgi:hypothetical protein